MDALLSAADHVAKLPSPMPEGEAASFLERHPLGTVFQLLSTHTCDEQQLETVCTALDKCLATQHGTALLPQAAQYAEAALASPQPRLRRLGCQQLGRLLRLASGPQVAQLESSLLAALQDADIGVASDAEKALAAAAAAQPARFAALLDGGSPAGQQLQALADSQDATLRMRAFALLIAAAAASSSNAQQLRDSGVVGKLLEQLHPRDPLSCLVALQLLQELVPHVGGAAAGLLQELLLPALLPLLDDAATAAGAFPIAARLVAAATEAAHAPGAAGGAAPAANGPALGGPGGGGLSNGDAAAPPQQSHSSGAAAALLHKMAAALDDRGSASPQDELVVLDAACQLALPSAASAALLASPQAGELLSGICSRALGRAANPDVRLAALHALASVAGVERAGEARDRAAALLPAAAEDALRRCTYAAVAGAAGGVGASRSPAEAVWQLLQQPFDETRVGVYRCCSALALRPWFAADAAGHAALLGRLCRTDSESGQQACEWRHSVVMALWATLQYLAGLPDDASEAQFKQRLPAGTLQQLGAAVRGGPYGAGGGRGTQQSHFVATVP